MEIGLVRKIDIDSEMQQAYLDYAMSVIIARALPDARDGLKPVHRRILYAMYDMGMRPESAYKKSARIVGEVLGKYHPHGDQAVYESMARMAQDFSMRCLLVDGQGNFGSVDGDPPAAMRYTEARLGAPAMELLADIQKNTVDFDANFDGSLTEPRVLPAAFPNLLVNGATGIAVGMSTSIPPHNLGEVVAALRFMLEKWETLDDINVEDLMHFVKGPDFPTGGVLLLNGAEDSLASTYGSGRGRVTLQASTHVEEMERGRNRIIVSELPYMTNKSALIERIAGLVRDEKLEGIADLRDESDRQGMRIVIELTKTADPSMVLRELYRQTPMQTTVSIILLALVGGEPRLLSLKQALRVYLDHRLEIIRRRSEFELERARQRAHILEGLRIALQHLDEIIDLIRKAPDADVAKDRLMKRYRLSEIQAQAILDLQLRRLAALERKKIELEYQEIKAKIKELEALLRSPKRMRQVISDELQTVQDTYGDRRRTQIVQVKEGGERTLLTTTDLSSDKLTWLAVMPDGLLARTHDEQPFHPTGNEVPTWLLPVNVRHTLYLATEDGRCAALPVHAIPEVDAPSQGTPCYKLAPLSTEDKLAAIFTLPPRAERDSEGYVLTLTRQGMAKKSATSELPGPSANLFTLAKVNDGDRLGWVYITDGKQEILLVTANGMAIRFAEDDVRPMGLVAAGVMSLKLRSGDLVVGAALLPQPGAVFLIAGDGYAKRVATDQFPIQGRYGQGVVAWKLAGKIQVVGMAIGPDNAKVTLFLERLAPKSIRVDEAPMQGRATRGRLLPSLKTGVKVIGVSQTPPPAAPGKEIAKLNSRGRKTGTDSSRITSKTKVTKSKRQPEVKQSTAQLILDLEPAKIRGRKKTTPKEEKVTATKAIRQHSPTGRTIKKATSKPATEKKTIKTKTAEKPGRKPAAEKKIPTVKTEPKKETSRSTSKRTPKASKTGTKPAAGAKKPRNKAGAQKTPSKR